MTSGATAGAPIGEVSIHIVQGEQRVSQAPGERIATLLGSCVAACLHDPIAKLGGMNHFLLPGDEEEPHGHGERVGVHAMEVLINALLSRGATRSRLEAKLFGGASTMRGLSDVGALNAGFALRFLEREGIRLASSCLGGERGRRVQFWPATGRARRSFMTAPEPACAPTVPRFAPTTGALELF